MNVNEVISNRCCQLAGTALGSKQAVHPNDHVNMAQSSNDSFPSAMYIAAAQGIHQRLLPAVQDLRDGLSAKAEAWKDIVKIGRTHMQDAVPLTLGQEFSGFVVLLDDGLAHLRGSVQGVYRLALGGTVVGTGLNAAPGFAEGAAAEIATLTGLPFASTPNKFAVQGSHDALVLLSGALKTLATSLYKLANDIRLSAAARAVASTNLIFPPTSPGRRSCPERSTPPSARRW
jgi:fumarate hydratase class II